MPSPWPAHFPAGCPPPSAAPATGTVFRLVRNRPPAASDFVPHILLFPRNSFTGCQCEACGLSVFTTLEECRRAEARIPSLRGREVASADLTAEHGALAATPRAKNPGHFTWWLPTDLPQPETLFSLVA